MNKKLLVTDNLIAGKIYMINGQKVMIDRDLAKLYNVQTKVLNQAVKRNIDRFPNNFMFLMPQNEFMNWRSQIVTSNSSDKMGLRHAPFCFTEQGVAMLSSVLKSKRAIEVNIRIIRIFTRMREVILSNKDTLIKLEQLEKKFYSHDDDIKIIFDLLKKLIYVPNPPRKKIGFKPD